MRNMDYIKDRMLSKIGVFLRSYPEVKFRYEYSDKYAAYLVAYVVPPELEENDSFWDAIFDLKSDIIAGLGEVAPLFSEEGRLFSLSSSAVPIVSPFTMVTEDFTAPVSVGYDFVMGDGNDNVFLGGFPEFIYAA